MLDTFPSPILESLPCSVCQGSKLSGLFYSIYVNELPNLHELIATETYKELTDDNITKFKGISHVTINYVDDSTNVIGFRNIDDISKYLNSYYKLLEKYYGVNMLKINPDKTKLLIICNKKLRNQYDKISFEAGNYTIKQDKYIKILGTWLQNNMSLDKQINYMVSKASNRIHQMRKINQYTNFQTRLSIINSIVIGIISYVLPLYFNCNAYQLKKLHKIQINACRAVIGNNCYKISNVKVLARCKWLSIANMMRYSVILFIHNIKCNDRMRSINDLFTKNKSNRVVPKSFPVYEPKYKRLKYFLLYKGNYLYNKLPNYIIKSKKFIFKKTLKQYIQSNFNPFKLHEKHNYNANSSDSSIYSSDFSDS